MNGLVDDLEQVGNELVQIKEKLQNTDFNTGEETEKLARTLADLEAHLNTSLITEKSVRKAHNKQLAEEVDQIRKDLAKRDGKEAAEDKADKEDLQETRKAIQDFELQIGKLQEGMEAMTKDMAFLKGEGGQGQGFGKGIGSEEADEMKSTLASMQEKMTEAEKKMNEMKPIMDEVKEQVDKLENAQYENQYEFATVAAVDSKM